LNESDTTTREKKKKGFMPKFLRKKTAKLEGDGTELVEDALDNGN